MVRGVINGMLPVDCFCFNKSFVEGELQELVIVTQGCVESDLPQPMGILLDLRPWCFYTKLAILSNFLHCSIIY